jgi:hypothetical protein
MVLFNDYIYQKFRGVDQSMPNWNFFAKVKSESKEAVIVRLTHAAKTPIKRHVKIDLLRKSH